MTGILEQIWRHPIKAHSRESLTTTELTQDGTLPGDRIWAVAHEQSTVDGSTWAPCVNFSRGSKAERLMALSATTHDDGSYTLTHPDLGTLTFDPTREPDKLIDWAGALIPENRAQSARMVKAETQAFTDSDFPSVTLGNLSSHRAVEQRVGKELSILRWRCNLWIEGLAPWEEFDWIDRDVQIGEAILRPVERTDRCLATHANPETGRRDVDILSALDSWGHRDFTVRARVIKGGKIATGDVVRAL